MIKANYDEKTKTNTLKAYSIQELAEYLQHTERVKGAKASSIETVSHNAGGFSKEEAIELAAAGGRWHEGAKRINAIKLIQTDNRADVPRRRVRQAVQGFAPNVPAFLSGEPENMLDRARVNVPKKVLTVGVQVGRVWETEQHQVLNRGKAIMAVIEELQLQGYSVEVWAVWRNFCLDSKHAVHVDTLIKPSTAVWQPSLAAFTLANLAFQRRLCWGVAETLKEAVDFTLYGYGGGVSADMSDFDISYGYVTHPEQYETSTQALELIRDTTNEQLSELNKTAS